MSDEGDALVIAVRLGSKQLAEIGTEGAQSLIDRAGDPDDSLTLVVSTGCEVSAEVVAYALRSGRQLESHNGTSLVADLVKPARPGWPPEVWTVGATFTCPLCGSTQTDPPGIHYGGAQCGTCRDWPDVERWTVQLNPPADA